MLTSCTVDRLADHYADLLALDWRRRGRLLESPASDVADLIGWDDRMSASVGALRHLGPPAAQHLASQLSEPLNAGQAFAILLYALDAGDSAMLHAGLDVARSLPHLQPALVAAMEWAQASAALARVVEPLPLTLRLQVLAGRHRDMPQLVEPAFAALRDSEPTADVICAALRCLRYLGDAYRARAGIHHLDHADESVRFVAAETLLSLAPVAQAPAAVQVLLRIAFQDDSPLREAVVRCLALHAAAVAMPELAALPTRAGGARLFLQALGWAGDTAAVPHLIDRLDDPQHARIAGAALSLLTGSDLVRDGWQGEAPPRPRDLTDAGDDAIPLADPDARLPWPSRAAFTLRWRTARSGFDARVAWFAGHPASRAVLCRVIEAGPLAWRGLAAARLQRLEGGELFPTQLRAPLQLDLFKTMLRG